jgi:integrase
MLPEIMAKLADRHTTSAFCLRFLILTATRSGEARGARWNEIDLAARTWTIPAERMKARVEHRIPLSEPALAILRSLEARKTRPDSLVFRGVRARSPLSDVTLSQALASEILGFTVHGCRSTFRDWCAETTDYHDGLAEAALAHANKNKIESAYRRTDLFELRGRLMGDWAAFCLSATSESGAHMPAQSARM